MPDYGRVTHYRSAGGMGMRLDAGTAFSGAVVYAVLRFAAGEGDRLGPHASSTRRGAMERCLPRVPHPRREDEHSVPDRG